MPGCGHGLGRGSMPAGTLSAAVARRAVAAGRAAVARCAAVALCAVAALFAAAAVAAPVSHLQVRIVTGPAGMSAGSELELRIYEVGRPVRRLSLAHGDAWPGDSTRVIPLALGEPLEPGAVLRFGLYYRPANPSAPALSIAAAEVDLPAGSQPASRLLDTTLSGNFGPQGELATAERDALAMRCGTDADCDDHRSCNGHERCAPRAAGADQRGCVKGEPTVCPVNEVCSERQGCHGPDTLAKAVP